MESVYEATFSFKLFVAVQTNAEKQYCEKYIKISNAAIGLYKISAMS